MFQLFIELLFVGVFAGTKIGIAALGFALIFFTTREMHFAFGALAVMAAYTCYAVVSALGVGPAGLFLGIPVAFAVTALVSVALHRQIYLRLMSVTPVLLTSLGISMVLENSLQILFTPEVQILTYPALTRVAEFGFLRMRVIDIGATVLFIVIAVALDVFMNHTRLGQGLGATIEDPEMAELVGIRTARMRVGAYCVGALLGATSGIVSLLDTGVRPAGGFLLLLHALIVTILGRGSLRLVAIWSVVFGVLQSLWAWQFETGYTELAVFAIVVLYLMARDGWDRWQQHRGKSAGRAPKLAEAGVSEG